MFRWYKRAKVCYAYLADVTADEYKVGKFGDSRWFTRGWTLQELIAPQTVRFYSADWKHLGTKSELRDQLHDITGIEQSVLCLRDTFAHICIAKRMSWAASRVTTRLEDRAYSLLGIFEVNMPLIYGEGDNAFIRLQQEILKVSDDSTLFAWRIAAPFETISPSALDESQVCGLLASSPSDFTTNHEILLLPNQPASKPSILSGGMLEITLPVCTRGGAEFAILPCTIRGYHTAYIGIPLHHWDAAYVARCGSLVPISGMDHMASRPEVLVVKKPVPKITPSPPTSLTFIRAPRSAATSPRRNPGETTAPRLLQQGGLDIQNPRVLNAFCPDKTERFVLDEVFSLPHAVYSPESRSLTFPVDHGGPLGALFFVPNPQYKVVLTEESRYFSSGEMESRILPFAIVLGSENGTGHWVAFVPILRESHEDEDFHELFRTQGASLKCCMTKSQLKYKLNDRTDEKNFLKKEHKHLDQPLQQWEESWRGESYLPGPKAVAYRHNRYSQKTKISLCVQLEIGPSNLLETTIFVCIGVEKLANRVGLMRNLGPFIYGREHHSYRPNWVTVSQEPWFEVLTHGGE